MKCNFVSLGCPKNLVDTEEIIGTLGTAGCEIAVQPEDADILLINTCGFIAPAFEETSEEIKKAFEIAQRTKAQVFVFGCAVERFESELRAHFPGIKHFYRISQRQDMIELITQSSIDEKSRLVTTSGYAYVKIADGCSNHCAYCTIPGIRGPLCSVPENDIINHVHELADLGIKELILVAQDTTRYGEDLYGSSRLSNLLHSCSKVPGISWIRVLYAHPRGISPALLHEIQANDKVCNYLDIPIQHINDRILTLMNRKTSKEQIETLFQQIGNIKGFSLRTTVIAGLPTETENEFMELINFLQDAPINWLGVFKYYPESNTPAALLPQLDPALVNARYRHLLDVQHTLLHNYYKKEIGAVCRVMIHDRNRHYYGHCEHSCPEIDDPIIFNEPSLDFGQFYHARFNRLDHNYRYAEIIDER